MTNRIHLAERLLAERYSHCDENGHYAPNNPAGGICGHCFRKLEYDSEKPNIKDQIKGRQSDYARGISGIFYLIN